jgi:hypothetical protein
MSVRLTAQFSDRHPATVAIPWLDCFVRAAIGGMTS